jgi:hypothetical protein
MEFYSGDMANSPARAETAPPTRSADSQDFEWLWHSLRNGRPMPGRRDLRLSNAKRFVGDLVLAEFAGDRVPVRIAGQRFEALVGCAMAGEDILDFMAPAFREAARETARLMAEIPCGLWQISPMHLARGYAQTIEITGFPLSLDGRVALMFLVKPRGDLFASTLAVKRTMALDTAVHFEFLNLGVGIPHWPPVAANVA